MADDVKPSNVAPATDGSKNANVLAPVRYWINVAVEDEFGAPIPDVRIHFDFDDGNKQGATTDADGRASLTGLPKVDCVVTLAGEIFYTDKSGQGTLVEPVEHQVTFREKDKTLQRIATVSGLKDGRAIYHYPKNAALRNKRVALGLVGPGDSFIVPAKYGFRFKVRRVGEAHEYRLVVPAMLEILKVDPCFVPSEEKIEIVYQTFLLSKQKKLTVEISSPLYSNNPIFKKELDETALSDGEHTLRWEGKANCTAGSLVGEYIHPLLSPYTVKLFVSTPHQDDATFKVLYHSLTLHFAPHTPDDTEPPKSKQNEWAQYHLDLLGYDAGPVDGTMRATFERAIGRFQRAHHEVGTEKRLEQTSLLDSDTIAALEAATAKPRWSPAGAAPTADAKLYLEDNFFNDPSDLFATAGIPEFWSRQRRPWVEAQLDRPFVPLEVEVKLVSRFNQQGKAAPVAVGPVTVAWEAQDVPEVSVISAGTNPHGHAFVENALKHGLSGTTPINQNGDNAPTSLGGFRDSSDAVNVRSWFPDDADSRLQPYTVKGYGTESRDGKTFQRALVDVYFHATDNPNRAGRAGLYLRHSLIAGDNVRVRAALSFDGLPNAAALTRDHAPHAQGLVAQSGTWTIWRRSRINAYCQQATSSRGKPIWSKVVSGWREAYIELENGGNPEKLFDYAAVVDAAKYKAAVMSLAPDHLPAGVTTASDLTYRVGSLYGRPVPAQKSTQTAREYVKAAGKAMEEWVTPQKIPTVATAVLGLFHAEARKTMAEGHVVFDFRVCEPITGRDWDPDENDGAGGFVETDDPFAKGYTHGAQGFSVRDGAFTLCVDNTSDPSGYVLHEGGHGRFLQHHKTKLRETPPVTTSEFPDHHDPAQDRCMMSYSVGPEKWLYPFCGKCILRLRGWQVP
jgi:hypothetical protein